MTRQLNQPGRRNVQDPRNVARAISTSARDRPKDLLAAAFYTFSKTLWLPSCIYRRTHLARQVAQAEPRVVLASNVRPPRPTPTERRLHPRGRLIKARTRSPANQSPSSDGVGRETRSFPLDGLPHAPPCEPARDPLPTRNSALLLPSQLRAIQSCLYRLGMRS